MMSLKKLIAVLAVSLPFAAFAQAPAAPAAPATPPLFNIYGTLNVNFQVSEATGSTVGPQLDVKYRTGVSVDSTNIGIRGTANVAHGLGVVYQCETSAQVDGVGIAGLCGRNSRLGVSSAFGTLFYGNWDTPWKAAAYGTKADDPFGNTDVFDAAGLFGSPGLRNRSGAGVTAAAGTNSGFNIRAANSVAYHSPKVSGFGLKAQYSANEFADNKAITSPELGSVGINYDMGPFSILAAYERHWDWNGQRSEDDAFRVGAGFELGSPFGTTTIGVNGDYLVYNTDNAAVGAVNKYERMGGWVGLKHRMGMHEFRVRYNLADTGECDLEGGATCNADQSRGAQQYALGYAYHLSKAAQIYAFWTQIENEANATYTFATAGIAQVTPGTGTGATATPGAGADPWAAGLGMRYAF